MGGDDVPRPDASDPAAQSRLVAQQGKVVVRLVSSSFSRSSLIRTCSSISLSELRELRRRAETSVTDCSRWAMACCWLVVAE